jgi:YMGG-like Gly-zipper
LLILPTKFRCNKLITYLFSSSTSFPNFDKSHKKTTMKKLLLLAATVIFFAACNNDSKTGMETTKQVVADTAAQYTNTASTDTAKTTQPVLAAPSPSVTTKQKEKKPVEATKSNSTKATVSTNNSKPVATETTVKDTTAAPVPTTGTGDTKTTTPASTTAETTTAPQKKGMSNTAKDAIIGGGVGAVGGAIISKKKGKGAIIGGLLGAGAGYIIGKNKDKKDTLK